MRRACQNPRRDRAVERDRQDEDVTALLEAVERGDKDARDRLFVAVYDDLRQLAHGRRRAEAGGRGPQTTSLVHDAYVRLCGGRPLSFQNRRHFFGVAARAMREILVDHARARKTGKRGGGVAHELLVDHPAATQDPDEVLLIAELLERLASIRPRHAEIVSCRFVLGMTVGETAELLEISTRLVEKDWNFARAWLKAEMAGPSSRSAAEPAGDDRPPGA